MEKKLLIEYSVLCLVEGDKFALEDFIFVEFCCKADKLHKPKSYKQ